MFTPLTLHLLNKIYIENTAKTAINNKKFNFLINSPATSDVPVRNSAEQSAIHRLHRGQALCAFFFFL